MKIAAPIFVFIFPLVNVTIVMSKAYVGPKQQGKYFVMTYNASCLSNNDMEYTAIRFY